MIDRFLTLAADPAAEADLRREVARCVHSLRASAGRGDARQVTRAEAAVQADPVGVFTFDASGLATLAAAGGPWPAGRFEMPLGDILNWYYYGDEMLEAYEDFCDLVADLGWCKEEITNAKVFFWKPESFQAKLGS
jgi:hypothetical protein